MKVYSELHGKKVELSFALSALSGQEGNDSNEYDLMQAASDRIHELESAMKDFIDHASKYSLIGQTKRWKEKFKELLK